MVLTWQGSEGEPKALATVVGPPGGCSGLSEAVPVNLLVSIEEKEAHELLGDEGKWKHPLVGRDTFENGLATERAHGGSSGRSWGGKTASGRFGGVESVPGSALGLQGDGEGDGKLELAREVACRV